ncbi:gametocyte-specific factor 1-like [Emys orbicularis]|uniref:gametocyte-specific factor 1-like n=1 Tax=Emys orbicularis TaxID=82168 RepID=UPI0031FE1B66
MDPERLIPCPYDKNHQIRASRFPYHLVKCGENNKKRAKELATCPYNARHRVPKRELQLHISTCTDNRAPELFSGTSMTFSPKKELKETPRSWQCPPCQEDWEAVDALDPEKLIQCPYDKSHQIRACRFPYHLIKCRKNHPDIAKQLATCPFNARHLVPRDEISHHISSCDDKSCIEQDIVSQSNNCYREKMNTVSMWQPPPCDEDWDKEIQEQSNSTFVWGTFNSGINNSPGSSVVMEPKNNLMPGMRAPKSLPYSLSWKSRTSMTFSPKKELKETPRSWQCPPCQEDWEAVLAVCEAPAMGKSSLEKS